MTPAAVRPGDPDPHSPVMMYGYLYPVFKK